MRLPLRNLVFELGALPYALITAQPIWRTHGGKLAELCELKEGQQVLDLGCGPGESAFGMVDQVPGLRVTGIDISSTMIGLAKFRQRFMRYQNGVEFHVGDAMKLPYPDGSFDAVTGHSFLYLVPDVAAVLTETVRVLKPGGFCAFLEPLDSKEDLLLPPAILHQTFKEPRFVTSMILWKIVSRGYGRFDESRFARAFSAAGLRLIGCHAALSGLGLFGVGQKQGGAPTNTMRH